MQQKITEQHPEQVNAARDLVDDAFARGVIKFHWNMSSMYRWNPYRSYIKMRVQLSLANGDQLETHENIAPNMYMGHCFWNQIIAKCKDVPVSQLDDYVAQVGALRERFNVSESRKNSLLKELNMSSAYRSEREQQVCSDGFLNREAHNMWPWNSLKQDDQKEPENDEEFLVAANELTRLVYQANGGGGGRVTLTETNLEVGDWIFIREGANAGYIGRIDTVVAGSVVLDRPMVEQAATEIQNALYYSKTEPVPTRRTKTFEIIFRPCIGLFQLDEWMGGDWTLEMHPHTVTKFKKHVIESLANKNPGVDYDVQVKYMGLYLWKGKAGTVAQGEKKYMMNEIRCQMQTITDSSYQNKSFVVKPKSHTLTMAFQKQNAGELTQWSRSKFICANRDDLKLQQWQMRMNGVARPIPTPSIEYDDTIGLDYTSQYYYDNMMYLRNFYIDDPESLREWQERGPYYSLVLRDGMDSKVNDVVISTKFSALSESVSLALFDHYNCGFALQYSGGVVTKVIKDILKE